MSDGGPEFHAFGDFETMVSELAAEIVRRLGAAVIARGRASLVVSGGTTPGPLFDALAKSEAPWANVTVTLSDERWVAPSSDRSNEKLVRARLLVGRASAAQFVPLKTAQANAVDAEQEASAAIAAVPRPFDVVLLGMGADGHTASLIPNSGGLARALDRADPNLAHAIEPPASTGMGPRMTLSLRALLDSHWIVLMIHGAGKKTAYDTAATGKDILAMPVRGVLRQKDVPVSAYWAP